VNRLLREDASASQQHVEHDADAGERLAGNASPRWFGSTIASAAGNVSPGDDGR
jgi:hypothetical protein